MLQNNLGPLLLVVTVCIGAQTSARERVVDEPFVPNHGQWKHDARFVHRAGALTLLVENRGWIVDLAPQARPAALERATHVAVRMTFEGAKVASPVGEARLDGVHNYLLGRDRGDWRTSVPCFRAVRLEGLYPGVDVRLRSVKGRPRYDVLLAPGADLSRVSLRIDGASGMRIEADGSLVIETAVGRLHQPVPVTWCEDAEGRRTALDCRFVRLSANRFGFAVLGWDTRSTLTIDPRLVWSTYIGTNDWDDVADIAVDAAGVVTCAGMAWGTTLPTTVGAYQVVGRRDAFVTRFDPKRTGSGQLLFSTYLGGSGPDMAKGVSVTSSGLIAVAGEAFSSDFPTTAGAYSRQHAGARDAFASVLDPTKLGTAQLVYSTLFGGIYDDFGAAVSFDGKTLTIAGSTSSGNMPTTASAYQVALAGTRDAFVCRIDTTKGPQGLAYSTYLGATAFVDTTCLHVDDASGVLTIAGGTDSPLFPTTAGAFARAFGGGKDGFLSRLDPARVGNAQLLYSTFLGGSSGDQVNAIAVNGVAFSLAGETQSMDFPTTQITFDGSYNGFGDAFVADILPSPIGQRGLRYSTYLGGGFQERAFAVHADAHGRLIVAGHTGSGNFPTTATAFQPRSAGGHDAFLSVLNPSLYGLTYHGVLAPAAPWRKHIVPTPPEPPSCGHADQEACDNDDATITTNAKRPSGRRRRYYSWAELMQRVFRLQLLVCPWCSGPRKVLAFITDPIVIRKILSHLRLPTEPPDIAPARSPPQDEFAF